MFSVTRNVWQQTCRFLFLKLHKTENIAWYNQFMSWVELLFFLHTFTAIRQKRSVDFGNAASCCAPVKINGYSEFTTILTPLTYTLLNTLLSERINILRFCPLISNGHVHWSPTDRRSLLWVARDPCFL